MQLETYLSKTDFHTKSEIDRVKLLAFYYQSLYGSFEFSTDELGQIFVEWGFPHPNKSRLNKNLTSSKSFVKDSKTKKFRLHPNAFIEIKKNNEFTFNDQSEEIETLNSIIPETLYKDTRGYIIRIAKQINSTYENKLFDATAVLMRRLLEILLIHSYENHNIDGAIKDSNSNYKMLSVIIDDAKYNSKLKLSRNTKDCLDEFRELGNFSAHKIYYNARKKDIDRIILNYRASIEELLYKSALLK